jgi:hypothetical protein
LVTATISPGSSGSAVYNSDMELSGVVFAGSGDLGYAWTVPYEYVRGFLLKESKHIKYSKPSDLVNLSSGKDKSNEIMKKFEKICDSSLRAKVKHVCDLLQSNMVF